MQLKKKASVYFGVKRFFSRYKTSLSSVAYFIRKNRRKFSVKYRKGISIKNHKKVEKTKQYSLGFKKAIPRSKRKYRRFFSKSSNYTEILRLSHNLVGHFFKKTKKKNSDLFHFFESFFVGNLTNSSAFKKDITTFKV